MTGNLDLGVCLLLDVDNLQFAVCMFSVESSRTSNDGYFILAHLESENLRFLAVSAQTASQSTHFHKQILSSMFAPHLINHISTF